MKRSYVLPPVEQIPLEVWQLVLWHLRSGALCLCATVCKQWSIVLPLCVTRLTNIEVARLAPQRVSEFVNLRQLCLKGKLCAHIEDRHLSGLLSLEKLDLSENTSITGTSLTRLTNLTKLSLNENRNICDKALASLSQLRYLFLGVNESVTGETLSLLRHLDRLDFFDCPLMGDSQLSKLTTLRDMFLGESNALTGRCLESLSNLSYLNLGCRYEELEIDDTCLSNLTKLTQLQALDTSLSMDALVKLTGLQILAFDNWDEGEVCRLSGLPHLRHLSLTTLEPQNKLYLETALPNLRIEYVKDIWEPLIQ